MRVGIIEIYAIKKVNMSNMIDAHLRNAFIIKNHLSKFCDCDLIITDSDFIASFKKKYDVLMLAYSSRYAPFEAIKKLVQLNPDALKYMIHNEYTLGTAAVGGFNDYSVIANYDFGKVHPKGCKNVIGNHTLNLNLLFARKPNPLTEKKYDCLYYGTFRPGRAKYSKEYFRDEIYLSTTGKNFKKYEHIGCSPKWIGKLTWEYGKETLNNFRYCIYIEDEFTHLNYNHLANRWYECGFCNVVVFFDKNCRNTILNSEIAPYIDQIEFYFVSNLEELKEKIKICNEDFPHHLEVQKSWRQNQIDLRRDMMDKFTDIVLNKKITS